MRILARRKTTTVEGIPEGVSKVTNSIGVFEACNEMHDSSKGERPIGEGKQLRPKSNVTVIFHSPVIAKVVLVFLIKQ